MYGIQSAYRNIKVRENPVFLHFMRHLKQTYSQAAPNAKLKLKSNTCTLKILVFVYMLPQIFGFCMVDSIFLKSVVLLHVSTIMKL